MSNPVAVKWFSSTMGSAPSMTGAAGGLIAVLDACLVDGFGSVTLSSLVVADEIATATVNTGHGFLDHQVVLVAGATPSGLNGNKRITWVDANTFTFDATGLSDGTATGTITAKTPSLGWTKTYSGTNKAAYTKAAGTVHLLRIDDSATTWSGALNIYRTMSDIDTGTDISPSNCFYLLKSSDNVTARAWRLYGDDRSFYFLGQYDGTNWNGRLFFGDILSCIAGDAYHCALMAYPNSKSETAPNSINYSTPGHVLARAWDQVMVAEAFGTVANFRSATSGNGWAGLGPAYWPNLADKRMIVESMQVWEATTYRGTLPGLYNHAHTGTLQFAILYGDGDLVGHRFVSQPFWCGPPVSQNITMMIDITGPWR